MPNDKVVKVKAKRVRVASRVTAQLFDAIERDRVARGMKLQDYCEAAFGLYTRTVERVEPKGSTPERATALGLWDRYIQVMPEEKIEVMAEVMRLGLLYHRSARLRKAGLGRRRRSPDADDSAQAY